MMQYWAVHVIEMHSFALYKLLYLYLKEKLCIAICTCIRNRCWCSFTGVPAGDSNNNKLWMRYNYTCPFQVIAIKNIGGVTFLCSASMAYQAHNCNRFSWLQLINGGCYQSLYNLFIATQQGQVQGCISDLIVKETAENLCRLNVVDGNGDRHHSDQWSNMIGWWCELWTPSVDASVGSYIVKDIIQWIAESICMLACHIYIYIYIGSK